VYFVTCIGSKKKLVYVRTRWRVRREMRHVGGGLGVHIRYVLMVLLHGQTNVLPAETAVRRNRSMCRDGSTGTCRDGLGDFAALVSKSRTKMNADSTLR
jgi:hypothetical protein